MTLVDAPPVFETMNVEVPPPVFANCRIGCGKALTTTVGTLRTKTVTCAVELDTLLVAVNVYVVVAVGLTVMDPEAGCGPTPLSIDTEVDPLVTHDSVVC